MVYTAPLPDDMAALLRQLRQAYGPPAGDDTE
jgi:hypothetical protein